MTHRGGGQFRRRCTTFTDKKAISIYIINNFHKLRIHATMQSFPYSPRELKVTEARLNAIYDASALGLKGDKLALAAGLLPSEYRQLCQLDPNVELMAMKGAADAEAQMAQVLKDAALGGDTKSALAILQNVHGWASAKEQSKVAFGITNADGTAASLVIGWES